MKQSKKIPQEVFTAVTELLRPYCPGLLSFSVLESTQSHKETGNACKAGDDNQALKPLLTYKGFATFTGLSLPTVHRMAKRGDLQTIKIGPKSVRIPFSAVDSILNSVKISGRE